MFSTCGWAISWGAGYGIGFKIGFDGGQGLIGLVFGLIFGSLLTGLIMKWAYMDIQSKQVILITIGSSIGFVIGYLLSFPLRVEGVYVVLSCGGFSGLVIGLVMKNIYPNLSWLRVFLAAIGWTIGWVINYVSIELIDIIGYIGSNIIGGAIVGLVGGGLMFWQFREYLKSSETSATEYTQ